MNKNFKKIFFTNYSLKIKIITKRRIIQIKNLKKISSLLVTY